MRQHLPDIYRQLEWFYRQHPFRVQLFKNEPHRSIEAGGNSFDL